MVTFACSTTQGHRLRAYTTTCSLFFQSVGDLDKVNEYDVFGEESEDSGRIVRRLISTVVSTAEYHCCKVCRSKAEVQDDILDGAQR